MDRENLNERVRGDPNLEYAPQKEVCDLNQITGPRVILARKKAPTGRGIQWPMGDKGKVMVGLLVKFRQSFRFSTLLAVRLVPFALSLFSYFVWPDPICI
jgi:hypothetical protein